MTVDYPPIVGRVAGKLGRADLAGVNPHSLHVAISRAMRDGVEFAASSEQQIAVTLLQRAGAPESVLELGVYLSVSQTLTPQALSPDFFAPERAAEYVRWSAGFIYTDSLDVARNARIFLRWLVANYADRIRSQQDALNNLRRVADGSLGTNQKLAKNSAFIVYVLGMCGDVQTDYDRVIAHAEQVIEHDRENIPLVADALYQLYPPALLNAITYFLNKSDDRSKPFIAGLHLLDHVAEIEDRAFWRTYYDDLDAITQRLAPVAGESEAVERLLDRLERNLALSSLED